MKHQTSSPLVSVIMPVYNAGAYLREAIESVLAQTYTHWELICIDDASTDGSGHILADYAARYPSQIRIITMVKNLNGGGDHCANRALELARGEYIARMDADDVCLPTRLERQVEYLERHPRVYLVGSQARVIDSKGREIGIKSEPTRSRDIVRAYATFHPLIHPSLMYRRLLADGTAFRYQIKYSANNDYYTFFTLLCQGYRYANLSSSQILYRVHGANDTFNRMREKFTNTLKIRIQMVTQYGYRPTLKDYLVNIAQGIVVYTLPEVLIKKIYFIARGIKGAPQHAPVGSARMRPALIQ